MRARSAASRRKDGVGLGGSGGSGGNGGNGGREGGDGRRKAPVSPRRPRGTGPGAGAVTGTRDDARSAGVADGPAPDPAGTAETS